VSKYEIGSKIEAVKLEKLKIMIGQAQLMNGPKKGSDNDIDVKEENVEPKENKKNE
jgi:hypothetical protein